MCRSHTDCPRILVRGKSGTKNAPKKARKEWQGDSDDAESDLSSADETPKSGDNNESDRGDMDVDEKENKDPDGDGQPPQRSRARLAVGKGIKGDGATVKTGDGLEHDKPSPIRRTTRATRRAIIDVSGSDAE
jgi:hypothetical protein